MEQWINGRYQPTALTFLLVGVFIATWLLETAGLPWPRMLFAVAALIPAAVLIYAGRTAIAPLLPMLIVSWVTYIGSRRQSVLTLVLALVSFLPPFVIYIVEEALANVTKHAPGAHVELDLCIRSSDAVLRIHDSGAGKPSFQHEPSTGVLLSDMVDNSGPPLRPISRAFSHEFGNHIHMVCGSCGPSRSGPDCGTTGSPPIPRPYPAPSGAGGSGSVSTSRTGERRLVSPEAIATVRCR